MRTNTKVLAIFGAVALLAAESISIAAEAGELRVRCERRGNKRSKVSVDGRNVAPGTYVIQLTSGTNSAPEVTKTVVAPADEFEADYDSNRADIRAGATAIAATFIQGSSVTAVVTGAENLSATVSCRVR
jgi:hypothetical protein